MALWETICTDISSSRSFPAELLTLEMIGGQQSQYLHTGGCFHLKTLWEVVCRPCCSWKDGVNLHRAHVWGSPPQRPLSQGLAASMGWSCPEAPCFKCLPSLLKTDTKKKHKTSVHGRTWYKIPVLLTFSILLMTACWLVYHWTNTLKALVA